MTDKASPTEPKRGSEGRPKKGPKGTPEKTSAMARFLQDWTKLWLDELRARSNDPQAMADGTELWRVAMAQWADAMGVPPVPAGDVSSHLDAGASRTQAVASASVFGDAAIEHLARRVDELEARLAKLEPSRR